MMPAGYGSYYEIIQAQDYVALRYEMIHEHRVVPIDRLQRRPHVGKNHGDAVLAACRAGGPECATRGDRHYVRGRRDGRHLPRGETRHVEMADAPEASIWKSI